MPAKDKRPRAKIAGYGKKPAKAAAKAENKGKGGDDDA